MLLCKFEKNINKKIKKYMHLSNERSTLQYMNPS